jgi:uncharacterized membrane protein
MSRDDAVLDRHLRHWRSQSLLADGLEERLRAASGELVRHGTGRVLRTALGALGGTLLLAGLVLLVAENWPALPAWSKLAGWALVHGALLFGADAFTRRAPRPALGGGLALAACGSVLAGIALVSQIYQLDARAPNGVWLWLALLLPTAWIVRARAVPIAIFGALAWALGLEVAQADSLVRATHLDGPWLWLAIPWLAGAIASCLPSAWRPLRSWIGVWSFVAANVLLLVLGACQQLDRSDLGRAWIVALPGALAALAWPARVLPEAWEPLGARLFVILSLLPWVALGSGYEATSVKDQVAIAVSWVVQVGLAMLVMRAGARNGSTGWVNLAYLALLAGIVTRYFDFFGRYLEGGLALMGSGAVLLAVLYLLESARRRTFSSGGRS